MVRRRCGPSGPQPVRGSLALPADPEVRRVGGALQAAGIDGRSQSDADADLAELAPEDVGLVAWRPHPGPVDLGGRAEVARAPGDVLAQRPALAARVARAQDAIRHAAAIRRVVGEEAGTDHVLGMALGGPPQLGVLAQRREPAL